MDDAATVDATHSAPAVPQPDVPPRSLGVLVGFPAVLFSAVYLISDVLEVAQGDFSTLRLSLTYAGEAAIPLFVLGLWAVQRPRIGLLGLVGAIAYAYAYVFFSATVVYALVAGTRNYRDLAGVFGGWMVVHGVVMLLGGLTFGYAVIRAGALPRWTGACLMLGVVLVVSVSDLPNLARTIAAALPASAFAGMGWALLKVPIRLRRSTLGSSAQPGHGQDVTVPGMNRDPRAARRSDPQLLVEPAPAPRPPVER